MITHGETVTILRRNPRDKYGDASLDSSHEIHNVGIFYGDSSTLMANAEMSQAENRFALESEVTLYLRTGSDIQASDKVELPDGTVMKVFGKPQPWKSGLSGWSPGLLVRLKEVEG